jgi:hypothetical protein
MKRFAIAVVLAFIFVSVFATYAGAGIWWKHIPPVIVSPAANSHFGKNEIVTYCWATVDRVPGDSIATFELEFANAPPNTINLYQPDLGICGWDFVRVVNGYCYTATHQGDHEPVYWRVRTVYKDGTRSNWAVGYHLVGDAPGFVPPPTITYPPVMLYDCNPLVYHEWSPVPGAIRYEYGWAQSPPNTTNLFDNCGFEAGGTTSETWLKVKHDCWHLPIYFLVRAVLSDGSKTNWAIAYYNMYYNCMDCNPMDPVGVEESSWGKIKSLYR